MFYIYYKYRKKTDRERHRSVLKMSHMLQIYHKAMLNMLEMWEMFNVAQNVRHV